MTLTTTEELKHLASSDNTNELTRRLARECLANREAQPVGYAENGKGFIYPPERRDRIQNPVAIYTAPPAPANARAAAWEMRYWSDGYNIWGDWERISEALYTRLSAEHATDNDYEFRVLYDAPPAPAAPEKCPEHVRFLMSMHADDLFDDADAQEIWNACRAAMLAQPVSSSYKLPEGWIVCSEQTPVADGAYWCWFGKEKPSVIQQRVCIWNDRNHEWCDSAVTHWMPLPAAPEGGNENN
ncbi:DUF551 domain-containing protein [Serratia marcescens]